MRGHSPDLNSHTSTRHPYTKRQTQTFASRREDSSGKPYALLCINPCVFLTGTASSVPIWHLTRQMGHRCFSATDLPTPLKTATGLWVPAKAVSTPCPSRPPFPPCACHRLERRGRLKRCAAPQSPGRSGMGPPSACTRSPHRHPNPISALCLQGVPVPRARPHVARQIRLQGRL